MDKVGTGAVVLVIILLLAALGYIASRGASNFGSLLNRSDVVRNSGTVSRNSNIQKTRTDDISVTFPDNEPLAQGQTYTLSWTGGGSPVDISIFDRSSMFGTASKEAVWKVSGVRNVGMYVLQIPISFKGKYKLVITDGKKTATKSFEVEEQSSGAWAVYKAAHFELSYPSKIRTTALAEKDAYPEKQYGISVAGFESGVLIETAEYDTKYPKVQVLTYDASTSNLESWLGSHEQIKRGYSSQTRTTFNGRVFYKFDKVRPDEIRNKGKLTYRERNDIPQEMYVTVVGNKAYAILFDFGYTGRYTMYPSDIMKTVKIF